MDTENTCQPDIIIYSPCVGMYVYICLVSCIVYYFYCFL